MELALTVYSYVQFKSLLPTYCCIKFECILEVTCFPSLTWETWDLKGSQISMSLASPLGSRNPSSRLAKGLDSSSSQNLGRKPKCQPFTVPRKLWLISEVNLSPCLATGLSSAGMQHDSRASSLERQNTGWWWEQLVSQSCLYAEQWLLALARLGTISASPFSHLSHCLLA